MKEVPGPAGNGRPIDGELERKLRFHHPDRVRRRERLLKWKWATALLCLSLALFLLMVASFKVGSISDQLASWTAFLISAGAFVGVFCVAAILEIAGVLGRHR